MKTSLLAGLAAAAPPWRAGAAPPAGHPARARVALTTGTDRVAMAFEGLQPFREQVRRASAGKQIVIKPNNVSIERPLSATHADTLAGILEFLKSLGRTEDIVIAESPASGSALEGFANYRYTRVAEKYGVRLMDLDQDDTETLYVFDEKDFRPHPVCAAKTLLRRDHYLISATRLKTHDRVVATLSLKNIVVGAPIKDAGFAWGRGRRPGARSDKPVVHGSGFRAINFNLFTLAHRLRPDLTVLDGVEGMEGNGPVGGTPVDHRVGVVSTDWLAADRVGIELMGIDFAQVGYLNYCADGGLGCADLIKMEILGPPLADHVKHYRLSTNIDQQLVWMKPPA